MTVIKFKRLTREFDDVPLPEYKTAGSAGMDVRAAVARPLALAPGERAAVPTGLAVEIPDGYELQTRPRSGLALERGVTVLNAPGTIDSDYRGEIKIILVNHGAETFVVERGDRVAQLIVASVVRCEIRATDRLSESDRGEGGFGSTGKA
ncbi:MAG: dUTP diphosphatase [Ignavibacteriales bacterium]|nr:dUTP diphosphatase [Ignavibacteriales bacterium]